MRKRLTIALLCAFFVMGCGRDTTGTSKDQGPAAGDKSPKSPSPTTGNKGPATPTPSR